MCNSGIDNSVIIKMFNVKSQAALEREFREEIEEIVVNNKDYIGQ